MYKMLFKVSITPSLFQLNTYLEELNEQLYKYEEINLKGYATDEKQLEKYMMFKHPLKTEVKDKLEGLVRIRIRLY